MAQHGSVWVPLGFAAIALTLALVFVVGVMGAARNLGETEADTSKLARSCAFGALAWMTLTALLAYQGVLAQFQWRPPPLVIFLVVCVALGIGVGASHVGALLARGLPLAALVGVQAFRLPLELVMEGAAKQGTMPPQMSFEGRNFDIVTGVSAIVVAWLIARRKMPLWGVAVWNIGGVTLLANVLMVAMRSTPMVHAFGTDRAHLATFVAYFPYVWLPSVMVVAAIAGHVIVTRKLRAIRGASAAHGP
jgi:hypothetical protein